MGEIVPALILDPVTLRRLRAQPRRAAYYCAAVSGLANQLEGLKSRLICRRGPPIRVVPGLAREASAGIVAWSVAYGPSELAAQRRLQASLEESGFRVLAVHDAPAVAPEESAAARPSEGGRGYRSFAPYYRVWSNQAREPLRAPQPFTALQLHSDRLVRFSELAGDAEPASRAYEPDLGETPQSVLGEGDERARLDRYLSGPALQYGVARDVPGGPATSRLSVALSFGTLSARTVLAAIDARASDRFLLAEERVALGLLRRALAQRDFFLQLAWFFGDVADAPLQSRMANFPFAASHVALDSWRYGRTGYPLVDAGIRQLHATGWMHPRARVVAASFLCFDLGVNWRVGRDEWDRHLEEDDAALSTGNWQWIAGVGADLAQFPRIYNPYKQARAYDPLATYVRRWVPELRGRPVPGFGGDAASGVNVQLGLPLYDDPRYPQPVVEHAEAARAFLRRYANYIRVR